ncbi:PAP2 superfamily protein [Antricoccus suffuscus]|uniref:PAP2 superfamily protein n=1 Tax=Antricoccus suffuscus TaxID=1629062 RepID=A0A2T1A572_9ACTN|nr:phosphatase PAP2 family protein [Antricoccus suffuscus]PRZ43750.1 PAP2 superfamily protein [Antricoccus suffuscus]
MRHTRYGLLLAYAFVLVVSIIVYGVPLDRLGITLWVLSGLTVYSFGRGFRYFLRILLDWIPFTAVLFLYDYTRGLADTLGMPTHVTEPIAADRLMFGGVPTEWLQAHFYTPGYAHWYDVLVTLVYLSHFFTTPLIAIVLWIRNRDRFRSWIAVVLAMALAGLATYILYPMAPPWYAGEAGLLHNVHRISGLGWNYLGLTVARHVLDTGQTLANDVAAMPSLHTGFAALAVGFFMIRAPWWRRVLLCLYPLAMGLALVYSGEHYVIDVLAGIAYAVAIITVWQAYVRVRARSCAGRAHLNVNETVGIENTAPVH